MTRKKTIEALKEFWGLAILKRTRGQSDLNEEEAMALANDEVHAVRREKARRARRTSR